MDEKILIFIASYWASTSCFFTEKQRRLALAQLALSLGWGGLTAVHRATGVSYESLRLGREELLFLEEVSQSDDSLTLETQIEIDRISNPLKSRRAGGGRKPATETYPDLKKLINSIVYDCSYGDPMTNNMWTNASLGFVRDVLINDWDIEISKPTISKIIKELGYSLQGNKKMEQVGKPHPDRDKQFRFIISSAEDFISKGLPVIYVDTKKKEYLQNTANQGREYRRKNDPRPVLDHDFHLAGGQRAVPYGIYVSNSNHGFINLGTSYDTAQFACASIRKWWELEGKKEFPDAREILILGDGGGSNGYRSRLFKWELGKMAKDCRLHIHMSHYPTGCSKWSKIEHRLFSEISKNWRGKPLTSYEIMLGYIRGTKTQTGLYVTAELDERVFQSGLKVTDKELKRVVMVRKETCPNWNYVIKDINLDSYEGKIPSI